MFSTEPQPGKLATWYMVLGMDYAGERVHAGRITSTHSYLLRGDSIYMFLLRTLTRLYDLKVAFIYLKLKIKQEKMFFCCCYYREKIIVRWTTTEIEGRSVLTRDFSSTSHVVSGSLGCDAWRISYHSFAEGGNRARHEKATTMRNRLQFTKELRTRTEYRPFDIPAIIGTGKCSGYPIRLESLWLCERVFAYVYNLSSSLSHPRTALVDVSALPVCSRASC